MSKNKIAIDYINTQLSGFKPEFVKWNPLRIHIKMQYSQL